MTQCLSGNSMFRKRTILACGWSLKIPLSLYCGTFLLLYATLIAETSTMLLKECYEGVPSLDL